MILPKVTSLLFAPTGQYVEAQIVELTAELAERRIHRDWWNDGDLTDRFDPPPIDRYWDWNDESIDYKGMMLRAEQVAVTAGGDAVQGAMMISTEPAPSTLTPGVGALFVELLFTAPRNRPNLRCDGKPLFMGVGTELLTWGAWRSRELGHEGRLILDGSPDFVAWYEKRGLQKLGAKPMVFEGVTYTPMELAADAARRLLADWD